jgi:hypothetical protein
MAGCLHLFTRGEAAFSNPHHASLTHSGIVLFNAHMKTDYALKSFLCATLLVMLTGCASEEPTLPPPRAVALAGSPGDVLAALPGDWRIDVNASAEVLARKQFESRQVTVTRRVGMAPSTLEPVMVAERFDPRAYREARRYWASVLSKPDMQWCLRFNADGTGEHLAVVQTGSEPRPTTFKWRLEGWRLRVDYPDGSKFKSFEVEVPSAVELNYPMQPLGDHLVLRRDRRQPG